jgi:hypothetical protein
MHVTIAGGSGFLGTALAAALAGAGHSVTILTRRPAATRGTPAARYVAWNPDGTVGGWADACQGTDVVVNLAGESIAAGRWTARRKQALLDSRVRPTASLARFIAGANPRPAAFISSSAIGYYGPRGEDILTEASPSGTGVLADIGRQWEEAAAPAASTQTRVAIIRTGIVLDAADGALAKMLVPFRLGLGGPFGSGRQYMSWIHRDDWVALARWLVESPGLEGPFNATAPHPITNAAFAKTLGRVLNRPAVAPAPAFVLRIALGEMAGPLLLDSQRVVPARALAAGFTFAYPALEDSLRALTGR